MKQDFVLAKEELSQIGILRVSADLYAEPKRKGTVYFVRSPQTTDKTASLALYPNTNRFCDFANGNKSGDCISFVAYVRDCNQWEALKELQAFYGLSDAREQGKQEASRRIQQQEEREHQIKERRAEFEAALSSQIQRLKQWELLYKNVLESHLQDPLGDAMAQLLARKQYISYQLDVLCSTDATVYPHLKPEWSSYWQWLLDVLAILQAQGAYVATGHELGQITARRDALLAMGR